MIPVEFALRVAVGPAPLNAPLESCWATSQLAARLIALDALGCPRSASIARPVGVGVSLVVGPARRVRVVEEAEATRRTLLREQERDRFGGNATAGPCQAEDVERLTEPVAEVAVRAAIGEAAGLHGSRRLHQRAELRFDVEAAEVRRVHAEHLRHVQQLPHRARVALGAPGSAVAHVARRVRG